MMDGERRIKRGRKGTEGKRSECGDRPSGLSIHCAMGLCGPGGVLWELLTMIRTWLKLDMT